MTRVQGDIGDLATAEAVITQGFQEFGRNITTSLVNHANSNVPSTSACW